MTRLSFWLAAPPEIDDAGTSNGDENDDDDDDDEADDDANDDCGNDGDSAEE